MKELKQYTRGVTPTRGRWPSVIRQVRTAHAARTDADRELDAYEAERALDPVDAFAGYHENPLDVFDRLPVERFEATELIDGAFDDAEWSLCDPYATAPLPGTRRLGRKEAKALGCERLHIVDLDVDDFEELDEEVELELGGTFDEIADPTGGIVVHDESWTAPPKVVTPEARVLDASIQFAHELVMPRQEGPYTLGGAGSSGHDLEVARDIYALRCAIMECKLRHIGHPLNAGVFRKGWEMFTRLSENDAKRGREQNSREQLLDTLLREDMTDAVIEQLLLPELERYLPDTCGWGPDPRAVLTAEEIVWLFPLIERGWADHLAKRGDSFDVLHAWVADLNNARFSAWLKDAADDPLETLRRHWAVEISWIGDPGKKVQATTLEDIEWRVAGKPIGVMFERDRRQVAQSFVVKVTDPVAATASRLAALAGTPVESKPEPAKAKAPKPRKATKAPKPVPEIPGGQEVSAKPSTAPAPPTDAGAAARAAAARFALK